MATGLLGTSDDREAQALVALVLLHGLVGKPNTNPFDKEAGESLIENAFSLSAAFLKRAKEPIHL